MHPYRTPARQPEVDRATSPLSFHVFFASLIFALVAITGAVNCASIGTRNLRPEAIRMSNGAVRLVDAGTHTVLSRYCEASMAAIGRVGVLERDDSRPTGERCAEHGPRAGTPATDAETTALEVVRVRWAPVLDKAHAIVMAQHAVATLLSAGQSIDDGRMLTLLGQLAQAYEELRQAAIAAHVAEPPPFSLGALP